MVSSLTPAQFSSALKILFPEKRLRQYGQRDQPFWAWLTKKEKFVGRKAEIPIRYSAGGGSSHTFADALAAKSGSSYLAFEVTRKRDYHIVSIDREALEASEGDDGAYMTAKESEIDAGFMKITQRLAADLQGDGTGVIGVVQSVTSATVFVVRDADMTHIEIGDNLVAAVSPFSTLRTSTGPIGYMKVTAVDYDNNKITVSTTTGDSTTQMGLTAADQIYFKGSFNNACSGTNAWIPSVRTSLSTPFNAVDRSVFPSRLAGIYFDGSTYGLAEALERGLARGKKEGSMPEVIWLNYNRFADLSLELGAKVVREPVKIGAFAFDSIKIYAAGREVRVLADQNFQDGEALAVTKDAWYFWSLKGAPRFITKDMGMTMLIEPASDGFELRLGWNGELVCRSPLDNIRFKLPT
jgi:hypothetical protein